MTITLLSSPAPSPDPDDLVEEFLAGLSRPTAAIYRRDLAHVAGYLAGIGSDLLVATRGEVGRYVRELEKAGVAPSSIRRKLSAMSGLYIYCVAEGHMSRSPVAGMHRPNGESAPRLGLEAGDLARLVGAAREEGPEAELLVSLLLFCGLRVSEAVGVSDADLVQFGGRLALRVRRKGGRVDLVGVPQIVERLVVDAVARQGPGPLLCGKAGGRLTRQVAWRWVRRLGEKEGIQGVHPHLARHSFVSQGLLAGLPLVAVSHAVSHRSVQSTIGYARALSALAGDVGEAVVRRIEGV